jgi:hypothetical protein
MEADQVAVDLVGLTPHEFTAARNGAAKAAKDASDVVMMDGPARRTSHRPLHDRQAAVWK